MSSHGAREHWQGCWNTWRHAATSASSSAVHGILLFSVTRQARSMALLKAGSTRSQMTLNSRFRQMHGRAYAGSGTSCNETLALGLWHQSRLPPGAEGVQRGSNCSTTPLGRCTDGKAVAMTYQIAVIKASIKVARRVDFWARSCRHLLLKPPRSRAARPVSATWSSCSAP